MYTYSKLLSLRSFYIKNSRIIFIYQDYTGAASKYHHFCIKLSFTSAIFTKSLRKYAQDEASKKLGNYGQLFYQTSDGSYTTNPALAKNIKPYYKNPNGNFTEVPIDKVNQELRDMILNNQTITNSMLKTIIDIIEVDDDGNIEVRLKLLNEIGSTPAAVTNFNDIKDTVTKCNHGT